MQFLCIGTPSYELLEYFPFGTFGRRSPDHIYRFLFKAQATPGQRELPLFLVMLHLLCAWPSSGWSSTIFDVRVECMIRGCVGSSSLELYFQRVKCFPICGLYCCHELPACPSSNLNHLVIQPAQESCKKHICLKMAHFIVTKTDHEF